MASGTRGTNTQAEALKKMLSGITEMKTMPDADLPFLTNVETVILGYLRAPFEAQQQQVSAQPGMGAPAGVGPAMGGPPPGMAGGRVPGILNHAPQPPVDELRRLLSA